MDRPNRKPLRLPNFDYSEQAMYFLTICVKDRRPIFSKVVMEQSENGAMASVVLSQTGKMVEKYILDIPKHYKETQIIRYVVMPDHVHLLLSLGNVAEEVEGTLGSACPTAERSAQTSIPNIIKAFKYLTNKEAGEKMWQKSYYDHVIRSREDFLTCAQYIETNPLRYLLKQE